MTIRVIFWALLILILSSCTNEPKPLTQEDVDQHRAMSQQFLDYVHSKDWESLSKMYEEEAVVMQMHTKTLTGPSEIYEFWSNFPPIKELRFMDDGIIGEGNLAYVYGRYWLQFDLPGNPIDEGKYLDVRRRQADGTWKYVAECANTSLPASLDNDPDLKKEEKQ